MNNDVGFISGTKNGCAFGINPKYISFWMVTDGILAVCVWGSPEILQFELPNPLLDFLVDNSLQLEEGEE